MKLFRLNNTLSEKKTTSFFTCRKIVSAIAEIQGCLDSCTLPASRFQHALNRKEQICDRGQN